MIYNQKEKTSEKFKIKKYKNKQIYRLLKSSRIQYVFVVCQDLIRRMIANQISPISYAFQMNSEEDIRNQTVEVLRNAQLLRQEIILICSPRDDQHKLIESVLIEVI